MPTSPDTPSTPARRADLSPARRALLERWARGRPAGTPPGIPRRPAGEPPRLSFSQERLWLLDRLLGEDSSYNTVPLAVRLHGPLDPALFDRALGEVVRRHEVLRTRFPVVDGEPRPVVDPPGPVHAERTDLRGAADPRAEADAIVREHRADPLDAARGPLLTARLLRTGDEEHVLALLMHHLVTDGWSDDVFVREIAELYRAYAAGAVPELPEPPVQYADFAAWQRDRLSGARLEGLLDHWRGALADAPAALELPLDGPRPAVQRYRGASEPVRVDARTTARLKALAKAEDATLFMVLLSAVGALLARYTGQHDVLVGTPVANRTQPQTEHLIGCFINTLVLRADLTGDPTFREALGRARRASLAAYAHQELPFERLVDELAPERDTGRHPLFQVMLALQNSPPAELEFDGFRLAPVELDNGVAKFDLTIDLREYDGELVGRIQYDADLFHPATRTRMTAHLTGLLADAAERPDARLGDLAMLDAAELHRVTREWNATEVDHPLVCLHRLIERHAAQRPDAVAVSAPDGTLTYRQLNLRADRLASELRRARVGPDTLVGLCLERGVGLAIGILGILKAGGAYVPVDPAYPPDRIAYQLRDANAQVVVTSRALRATLEAALSPETDRGGAAGTRRAARLVLLDGAEPAAATPEPATGRQAALDDLAYVIYTSGSTGRPKGVMITHRAAANMILSTLAEIDARPHDAVLQFATVCFDVSVLEIFTALCSGGRLVVPDAETVLDPARLTALVRREQVTVADIPPAVLEVLDSDALTTLRIQFIGCEAFGGPLATRWQRPGRRLINGYGPTEATVMMTLMELDRPYERMPPIGRPMPNHGAYVLDAAMTPVPIGAVGELYISGTGLARGYVGRPGPTARRFVPDRYGRPGAVAYRTGDLARHRPDGVLEFVGRADNQVKIRGYRIETGEVEAVLAEHPLVGKAVVVVRELTGALGGSRQLVAYVQPRTEPPAGERPVPHEVRDWLGRRLPGYLVPHLVVPVDRFPLSPSGKVDRTALPDPESVAAATEGDGPGTATPPGTAMERLLADRVFGAVLGVERVEAHSNFFQLGGNSLQLAQLQARIAQEVGVEVPLRELFKAPTVAALAEYVTGRTPEPVQAAAAAQNAGDGSLSAPLSLQQRRLWDRAAASGAPWPNKPLAARLRGFVDADGVIGAVGELVARHGMLRTTFDLSGPEPRQVVHDRLDPMIETVDLAGQDLDAVHRAMLAETGRVFDIEKGPLLRVALLRLDPYDQVVLVTAHPLVWDGGSRAVLAGELLALAGAAGPGRAALPPLTTQYADFAAWQRDWLTGPGAREHLRHWTQRPDGVADPGPLALPGYRPEAAAPEPGARPGSAYRFTIDPRLDAAARSLGQDAGVSLFTVFLTAFAVALHSLGGGTELAVGVPLGNRVRPGTAGLIGQFVNTLPLRVDLSGDPSFGEALLRVRTRLGDLLEHQELPAAEGAASPPVTFDYLAQAARLSPAPGLEITGVQVDPGLADVDLAVALEHRTTGLHGTVTCASDVCAPDLAPRLAGRLVAVLDALAARPDPRLRDLRGLADEATP
ncbi:amino acid adenylation domain-containing protein [Streptomyces sp. NPDC020141]|uniref:amino acid adenylation domain-containing protein n=1 Tax=Streptomyces sp. NPDC020141 TaxID=3365065 RepID=UPI0037908232